MQQSQIHTEDIKPLFQSKKEANIQEIDSFLGKNLSIKNARLGYTRHKLLKDGIIEKTGAGLYQIGDNRTKYEPDLSDLVKKVYHIIQVDKPLLRLCVWRTSVLNEFTRHQVGRFWIMVEVERDGVDAVFDLLRDNFLNVYVNPTEKEIDLYLSYQNEAIVVIPLVSESPIQTINEVSTLTIEKLLVDVLVEDKLYQTFQSELSRIIFEAHTKYVINKDKLLRYANRRRKRAFVEEFIKRILTSEIESK